MAIGDPIGLVIEADEPALFFRTPVAAETYLEAIDVRQGVYKDAFGPEGESYKIAVLNDDVKITRDYSKPNQPEKLRIIILKFLASANVRVREGDTLSELITQCAPFVDS